MSGLNTCRATFAIFVGALTGGLLVAIWSAAEFAASFTIQGSASLPPPDIMVNWTLASFLVATMVFIAGLILVGLPGWAVLHERGHRGPIAGALWGAFATSIITVVADLTLHRQVFLEIGDILLATSGAIVGLVVQRNAYSRGVRPPPAPPSAAPTP